MKTQEVVAALTALAQESRLSVFRMLVKQGPEGLTPGIIASKLDLPAPTLSFHLKQLSNSGLIAARQEGRNVVYTVDFLIMRQLVEFLYENCCGVGVAGCGPECLPDIDLPVAQPLAKLTRIKK